MLIINFIKNVDLFIYLFSGIWRGIDVQYKGNDRNVDADRVDEEMVHVDVIWMYESISVYYFGR